MIEAAREQLIADAHDAAIRRGEEAQREQDERIADEMLRTVHEDGIAVLRQKNEIPELANAIRNPLRALLTGLSQLRRSSTSTMESLVIPIEDEGQPTVYIGLVGFGPTILVSWQELYVGIHGQAQILRTITDRKGNFSWAVIKRSDRYGSLSDIWRGTPSSSSCVPRSEIQVIEEANGWREVMDTVLRLRPIDRAAM